MSSTGYLFSITTILLLQWAQASLELVDAEFIPEATTKSEDELITFNYTTSQYPTVRRISNEFLSGNIDNSVNERSANLQKKIPTSVEVRSDSLLYVQYGQSAIIHFQVTNNNFSPIYYTFEARAEDGRFLQVTPMRNLVAPASSIIVTATDNTISGNGGSSQSSTNLITFTAKWSRLPPLSEESVEAKVYVRAGSQAVDSTKPGVSYTFSGDCRGFTDPIDCKGKFWRADISVQDAESGLLWLKSFPVGLILNKEFIVGTRDEVTGYFRDTCCQTKVDIAARDVYGNEKILYIDIERIWLSVGEIIAIVLGAILLLLIIIFIIVCIVRVCRRRRSLSLYPDSRAQL